MMFVYRKAAFSFEVTSLLPHMMPDECASTLHTV